MTFILYILFGISPSLIWLFFYLKKDSHPESKEIILKVFFWGMLAAVVAGIIEIGVSQAMERLGYLDKMRLAYPLLFFLFYNFILVSFVEEYSKYFVVRLKAVKDSQFDEPVDVMIYMITAALGFAALENLLYIVPVLFPEENLTIMQAGTISFFRFVGATFLHALASAVAGVFLAISFYKKRKIIAMIGVTAAVILHGLFNISIIGIEGGLAKENGFLLKSSIAGLAAILFFMAVLVSVSFKKLKKLTSTCKIK